MLKQCPTLLPETLLTWECPEFLHLTQFQKVDNAVRVSHKDMFTWGITLPTMISTLECSAPSCSSKLHMAVWPAGIASLVLQGVVNDCAGFRRNAYLRSDNFISTYNA